MATGSGTLSLSGCLSGRDDDDTAPQQPEDSGVDTENETNGGGDERESCPYEECSREIIPYESLPADVRGVIDSALGEAYESDSICLTATMDTDASYIEIDGTYYDPAVTSDGDGKRLELQEITPKALPDARPIKVTHDRDGELDLEAARSVDISESRFSVLVIIEEEISIGGAVGDMVRCRYDGGSEAG